MAGWIRVRWTSAAAALRDSEFRKTSIDEAKTGRTTGGRTALLRLIADAEAGKLRGCNLWVYKFDRLGRSGETIV